MKRKTKAFFISFFISLVIGFAMAVVLSGVCTCLECINQIKDIQIHKKSFRDIYTVHT